MACLNCLLEPFKHLPKGLLHHSSTSSTVFSTLEGTRDYKAHCSFFEKMEGFKLCLKAWKIRQLFPTDVRDKTAVYFLLGLSHGMGGLSAFQEHVHQ